MMATLRTLVTLYLLVAVLNLSSTTQNPYFLHDSNYIDGGEFNRSALEIAKQWKLFTYNFQPNAPVNNLNFYNPTNILATGIAVGYDRIFVATPKLFSGVPSTVSFISKRNFGDSPVLQAFPDWSFSTTARTDFNCSDLVLISCYRMRIDSCNRLWILDAGISRSLEDYENTCPPKILVIDLNTNQVVRRIDFPKEILRGESLFTNLVIDETTAKAGTCDDVFVYISDTVEPGIIVYDSQRDVTWRLSHPAMYPDPDFAQSEILNDRFVLMDGVVGLAFDPKSGTLYFQPLATDRIFSASREVLRAGPIGITDVLNVRLVGKKSSQGIGMAVSPIDQSIIFSPLTETAIASWNPKTNKQRILAQDQDRLQFVADIISPQSEPGAIYAISSKFHRFFLKNVNKNEVNNRIVRIQLTQSIPIGTVPLSPGYTPIPLPQAQFSPQLHHQSIYTITGHPVPYHTYFPVQPLGVSKNNYHFNNVKPVEKINYSLKNPFNSLNHGESFPPSRGYRDSNQFSFLERQSIVSPNQHPLPYHYGQYRPVREVTPVKK